MADHETALPELTAELVDDDERVAEAVDAAIVCVTRTDPDLARLRDELLVQEDLLRAVAPEAWPQFLLTDELRNARTADLAVRLVRWAFTQGERSGRRSSGGR